MSEGSQLELSVKKAAIFVLLSIPENVKPNPNNTPLKKETKGSNFSSLALLRL